ncbi:MAG TPA: WXG100 family type VII secretion target [Propionibacteriaceae bacterium]
MKFAMGAETLSTLSTRTSSSHDDLGGLVRQLAAAADPLQAKFNGAGKAAFNNFKAHTDEIAVDLNRALASVLQGVQGQDMAFKQGDQSMAEETQSLQASAAFDSARFSGR